MGLKKVLEDDAQTEQELEQIAYRFESIPQRFRNVFCEDASKIVKQYFCAALFS